MTNLRLGDQMLRVPEATLRPRPQAFDTAHGWAAVRG
jgi:hypothetical protein